MSFAPYATPNDLAAWLAGAAPADPEATRLLNRASEVIDWTLIGSVYAVDTNGMPTDTVKIIPALRDAVCAQVEYWLDNGDEIGAGTGISMYKVEGLQVMASGKKGGAILTRIAPRAQERLQAAGLIPPLIIA